jgi:hypothetical protein
MKAFTTSIETLIVWTLSPDGQPSTIGGPARLAANGPAASGEDDPSSSPFVLAPAPGQ